MQAKPLPEFSVDDMQRLLSRIEVDDNGCWVVQNVLDGDYGEFAKGGKTYQAHRVAYKMFKGEVPIDRVVDHQCPGRANRACVNPQHLAVTTHKQNIRNAYPKCTKGHEKRFPNAFEQDGKLECVACFLVKLSTASPKLVPGGLCSNGHRLTWDNVYQYVYDNNVQVHCRACSLDRSRSSYATKSKPLPEMDAVDQRRLLALIDRTGDGCWEWQGWTKGGYGRFKFEDLSYPAHRIAYQLEHGKIGSEWQIDHLCNNRACCNPAHLEPVSPGENQARARARKSKPNPPRGLKKIRKPAKPAFQPPPGHMTVNELAEYLGITTAKIHRWIDRRQLPSYKRANVRYIVLAEYEKWKASRQVDAPNVERQLSLL